jgi:hypothetical protein
MDTRESSASAHPSTDEHDDTVEAHYSGLERLRPCACIDGLVFVGYVDEDGEEREASYRCRRCTDSRYRRRETTRAGISFVVFRPTTFGGGHTIRSAKRRAGRRRWQMHRP